jgi:uncharacterized protein YpmB
MNDKTRKKITNFIITMIVTFMAILVVSITAMRYAGNNTIYLAIH